MEPTDKEIIAQLRAIGAEHGWDLLYRTPYMLYGHYVYCFRRSSTPKRAKLGLPILFGSTTKGEVFELTTEQYFSLHFSELGELVE